MNDRPPAQPGHYDAQALVTAIGNYDSDGARTMLDAMTVDEARTVAFYLAEVFSMSSPLSHPDNVHRHLCSIRASEVDLVISQASNLIRSASERTTETVLRGQIPAIVLAVDQLGRSMTEVVSWLGERSTLLHALAAGEKENH